MTGEIWRRRLFVGLAAALIGGVLGCSSATTSTSSTPTKANTQRDNKGNPPTPPKADPG